MARQPRHDPGPSGEPTGSRDRGTRRRLTVAGAAAGIALGLMAGWVVVSNGTGSAEDAPTSGDRPVAATDDELLHRASERLIARCMARHGFAYAEQPPPSSTQPDFRYVLDDVGSARKHGYGNLLGRPGAGGQDANVGNLGKLSPGRQNAWHRTLMGSGRQLVVDLPRLGRLSAPDNGCTAEARRTLYGDLAGWYRVRRTVDHFDSYVDDKVVATPEYRTGLAAWVTCVRKRGYAASTPNELRRLVAPASPESAGEQAQPQEIAAAVTEAECATSTRFARTIGALERRHRPEIERRFAHELDALKSFELKAIPQARRVLADA
ncbi:hypothetical protein [Actinomadura sp. HBU206391]|uniref:hypothetical protein n=1 Tax=Actinomadura sp. HBU206391 TaxID=2731692 RepID=UPI0016507327|nr:hypothetical protein [Actinomadura sp. HBU206391]MBC6462462.1 hypothetical protein [Actinomadura sp. HBU206391]